jgi:predicted dehydrogenase
MNAGKGDTLRVAIIGYGHAGSIFHAPLVASTPGLDIAAVVTSQPDRQARVRRELPEAAVLSSVELVWERAGDFDLVVIVTPNRTYVTLALAALQAGLPVVVDKPLAASVADAKQLIVASQQAGKLLTVFQNARWSRGFLTVQRLIAAELLGPIVRYEAHSERYRPEPRPGAWRELGDAMEAGGLLYDLGSHLIDQALVLFGAPTSVYAEVDQRRPGTRRRRYVCRPALSGRSAGAPVDELRSSPSSASAACERSAQNLREAHRRLPGRHAAQRSQTRSAGLGYRAARALGQPVHRYLGTRV